MSEKVLDLNNINDWRENPEFILRIAMKYAWRWGAAYSDKEDLQMYLVETILKSLDKFKPEYGTSLNGYIWMACKRAVLDYGRKYGAFFKGRNPETRIFTKTREYHEIEISDLSDQRGAGELQNARFKAANHDKHENYDLIQALKKESYRTRKVVFYFYFLDMLCSEIGQEMEISESRVWQILEKFRYHYHKKHLAKDKKKFLSSSLEDLPMEKLEDFYELVQKQSNLTSDSFWQN